MTFVTFPEVQAFEDFDLPPEALAAFEEDVAPKLASQRAWQFPKDSQQIRLPQQPRQTDGIDIPGGRAPLGSAQFEGGLLRGSALETRFGKILRANVTAPEFTYISNEITLGRSAIVMGRATRQPRIRVPSRREPIPAFPEALNTSAVLGDDRNGLGLFVLLKDFAFFHGPTSRGYRVRRHFESDGASIPPIARGFYNSAGRPLAAAVVHDFLYAVGPRGDEQRREEADDVFFAALLALGVARNKADDMYRAVRAGGKEAFGAPAEWRFCDPDRNGQRYEQLGYPPVPRIATAIEYTGPISGYAPRPPAPPESPYR